MVVEGGVEIGVSEHFQPRVGSEFGLNSHVEKNGRKGDVYRMTVADGCGTPWPEGRTLSHRRTPQQPACTYLCVMRRGLTLRESVGVWGCAVTNLSNWMCFTKPLPLPLPCHVLSPGQGQGQFKDRGVSTY
jgi:hypothetical protein